MVLRLPALPLLVASSLALLAACGGGDTPSIAPADDPSDAAPPPSASPIDASIAIDGASPPSDASPTIDAAIPAADANDATPPPALLALGYYTGSQGSYDAITSFHASLTSVSADLFLVKTDGSIVGADDQHVVAHDGSFGLDTFACVSNYSDATNDFDAALGHAAMVTRRDAVIAAAVALAQSGYAGINVDFESIAYSADVADDRAAYSAFVHALATRLHAAGKRLVLSIPPKTADSPTDTWSYPFDFAAIGADADVLQLMTYDEHGPGWSGPGAIAGADWVKACLAYATSVAPAAKILIGLPAYGYDWDLTASNPGAGKYVGGEVAWKDAASLAAKPGAVAHWDATTSSPYVDYTASDGHAHEAWYEDARSIAAKAALVAPFALGGVSMWSLGEEDASFWQAAK